MKQTNIVLETLDDMIEMKTGGEVANFSQSLQMLAKKLKMEPPMSFLGGNYFKARRIKFSISFCLRLEEDARPSNTDMDVVFFFSSF